MKHYAKYFVPVLLFINIITLVTGWSASYIKIIILFLSIIYWILYVNNRNIINNRIIKLSGFYFYAYYIVSLLGGLYYGYSIYYVLVNVGIILPIMSVFFIDPKHLNKQICIKSVYYYALFTSLFSILIFFGWDHIPLLRKVIINSNSNDGGAFLTRVYNPDNKFRTIRAVGLFSDAYQNGLFILFGFIIWLEKKYYKNRVMKIIHLLIFLTALYSTRTRNIYLLFFIVLFLSIYIRYTMKYNHWIYSVVVLLLYLIIMVLGILYGIYNKDGSVFSRVYSWGVIYNEYIRNGLFSFRGIFGYALTQFTSDYSPTKNYWYIDNNLLSIYLGAGCVGIFLFSNWIISLFNFFLKKLKSEYIESNKSEYRIIILGFSVFFLGGVMNVNVLNIYYLLPLILILMVKINDIKNEHRNVVRLRNCIS